LPYGFTLFNTQKNRDFNFFSDRITEVNKWVDAIKAVTKFMNKFRFKQDLIKETKEKQKFL